MPKKRFDLRSCEYLTGAKQYVLSINSDVVEITGFVKGDHKFKIVYVAEDGNIFPIAVDVDEYEFTKIEVWGASSLNILTSPKANIANGLHITPVRRREPPSTGPSKVQLESQMTDPISLQVRDMVKRQLEKHGIVLEDEELEDQDDDIYIEDMEEDYEDDFGPGYPDDETSDQNSESGNDKPPTEKDDDTPPNEDVDGGVPGLPSNNDPEPDNDEQ